MNTPAEVTVAVAIGPVSSFFFPYAQPTLYVNRAPSSTAATARSGSGAAAGSAVQGSGNGTVAAAEDSLAAGLADSATATADTLLAQTLDPSALSSGTSAPVLSNLAGMALVQAMFANGANASVLGYPSAVSLLPSFLTQVQNSFVPRYDAFGMIDAVQSPGALINVAV